MVLFGKILKSLELIENKATKTFTAKRSLIKVTNVTSEVRKQSINPNSVLVEDKLSSFLDIPQCGNVKFAQQP